MAGWLAAVSLMALVVGSLPGCKDGTIESASDFAVPREAGVGAVAPIVREASPTPDLGSVNPVKRDAMDGFIAWLEQHPDVTMATINREYPIARARYSDALGTVACGASKSRAVCVRHPESVRHIWTLAYRRRDDGNPALTVALGPLPGDERHGAAYEFRLPEATVHGRGLYCLANDLPASLPTTPTHRSPSWAGALHRWVPVTKVAPPPSAKPTPLATVPAPSWVTDEGFSVGMVEAEPEPILNIEGEKGTVFCRHQPTAWQCFSPVIPPLLSEVEPALRPGDRRLKVNEEVMPMRVVVSCVANAACSVLVEWEWTRTLIAHSYRAEGSFVTLYRTERGSALRLGGVLRTGASTLGFNQDFSAYLEPRLVDETCVELTALTRKTTFHTRFAVEQLPPAGRYCLGPAGFCHVGSSGKVDGRVPDCRP